MELFDRFYALHHELDQARHPIPMRTLCERLQCHKSTIKRVMERMKLYYNAPIHYDHKRRGYIYQQGKDQRFELPGIWFTPDEILALLTFQALLSQLQPGLLNPLLDPLNKRINNILAIKQGEKQRPSAKSSPPEPPRQLTLIDPPDPATPSPQLQQGQQHQTATAQLAGRIRLITQAARHPSPTPLTTIADAIGRRQRLHIRYHGRGRDQISERDISPQRLTHYRDNWYLEAWCHQANSLRRFAVDRILKTRRLDQAAKEIAPEQLAADMDAGYGIFGGTQTHTAVLQFTPERARWIADEHWHPDQKSSHLSDGSYRLEIPYTDPRELILDILRYGPDVKVLQPPELQQQITDRLQQALAQYR